MKRLRLVLMAAVIVTIATSTAANASLVLFTYEQIQSKAELIVLGRVTGSTSVSAIPIPHQIRHVAVQRYFKGSGPLTLEVKELGGDIGLGSSVWVEDQPELSIGTTYLLFLVKNGDGSYTVFGGPGGALPVTDGVASNSIYRLKVTGPVLVPVQASGVRVTGLQNRTYPIAKDPAEMKIQIGDVNATGYWTFHVKFSGISGEAAGISSEQDVGAFINWLPYIVLFSHNFTAPGIYRVEVDGLSFGELEVRPPMPQLCLTWAEFDSSAYHVREENTLRVGPIPSNMTGEYRAVAVVTPEIKGWPFDVSYASFSQDSNWFTFHFEFSEPGNYTVTIWQGGVKQLSKTVKVLPPLEVIAGEPADIGFPTTKNTGPIPMPVFPLPEYAWLGLPLLAVISLIAYVLIRFYRRHIEARNSQ